MNTTEYMANNKSPKDTLFLLDLYRTSVGMEDNTYDFVKGLLSTAFQEGILYQLTEDCNTFKTNNHVSNPIQYNGRTETN